MFRRSTIENKRTFEKISTFQKTQDTLKKRKKRSCLKIHEDLCSRRLSCRHLKTSFRSEILAFIYRYSSGLPNWHWGNHVKMFRSMRVAHALLRDISWLSINMGCPTHPEAECTISSISDPLQCHSKPCTRTICQHYTYIYIYIYGISKTVKMSLKH